MSSHMQLVRASVEPSALKATAEAIRLAVGVTENELVTARAGFLGRWGSKVEHFPLSDLTDLRFVPNPSANLLQLEFHGSPPKSLVVMFERQAATDFEHILSILRERLVRRRSGGS